MALTQWGQSHQVWWVKAIRSPLPSRCHCGTRKKGIPSRGCCRPGKQVVQKWWETCRRCAPEPPRCFHEKGPANAVVVSSWGGAGKHLNCQGYTEGCSYLWTNVPAQLHGHAWSTSWAHWISGSRCSWEPCPGLVEFDNPNNKNDWCEI